MKVRFILRLSREAYAGRTAWVLKSLVRGEQARTMGMYSVAIEWSMNGRRKKGMVFFEADSLEEAQIEAPRAVEKATFSLPNIEASEPAAFEPPYLVMWDKSEISAQSTTNLLKLEVT